MPRRQRFKAKIDPTKRHPPFGATKAQGQLNERERGYKNRIHELEQTVGEQRETIAKLSRQLEGAWKLITETTPTQTRYDAIKRIASMSATDLVRAGIQHEAVTLALWLATWDAALATGKDLDLQCPDCLTRFKPGKHTRCKPIAGNTVKYTDGHGNVLREEPI